MNREETLKTVKTVAEAFELQLEALIAKAEEMPEELLAEAKFAVEGMWQAVEAVKAYEPWRSPEEPPAMYEPVILCRVDKEGNKRVEAGSLQEDGWYKIYGTRTKKILGWMPMPEAMKDA